MNILEALLLFSIGFIVGGYFILTSIRKLTENEMIRRGLIEDTENPTVEQLNVEVIQDNYYIFDAKKNSFICQGKTLEESLKSLMNCNIPAAMIAFEKRVFIMKNGLVVEIGKK